MGRFCTIVVVAVGLGALTATASTGAPPPGASARCRDGTYSYSQHRQGTCSHHGGVATWLTGSSSRATSTSSLGSTVLLGRRTRSTGCVLGPSPDRTCSPGAYFSGLTKSVICSASFRTSDVRNVPESEKLAVEREYGLAPGHYGRTLEIDHIVSLELGGSNDIANLFPERLDAHPGYRVKDKLENRVHDLVCAGSMTLRSAQRRIATDWQALNRQVYGVAPS
jgi:hypothetical protein